MVGQVPYATAYVPEMPITPVESAGGGGHTSVASGSSTGVALSGVSSGSVVEFESSNDGATARASGPVGAALVHAPSIAVAATVAPIRKRVFIGEILGGNDTWEERLGIAHDCASVG